MNLHPCVIVTFPVPTSPALLVTVQLYVPKSFVTEKVTSTLSDCSERIVPVFSFLQMYVAIPGCVLVTLHNSVIDPPSPTFKREAVTSTSGGTDIMV